MNAQQFTPVALEKAYRLLNHGPVVLVTSAHGKKTNVMAAAWVMPLDFSPPKVAVVIDRATTTRGLIEASGEFALNIPTCIQAAAVLQVGTHSGAEDDKFALSGLGTFPATRVQAPLVAGCVAWLECRVIAQPDIQQGFDLFLGEVVAAAADRRAFQDGRWTFDDPALRTLHYVAGGTFFVTGETLTVA